MDPDLLPANGVDASTGDYLVELSEADLVAIASGQALDAASLAELRARRAGADTRHYGLVEGLDPGRLEQAGWGVVFPAAVEGTAEARRQAAIREALAPLLELRRTQAGRDREGLFREFAGQDGVRPQEGKPAWLARHGEGPGPADPARVPYYLLLVGDPVALPFRVQSQLGVQRAVGRLHFDTVEEYAAYARSVVAAESRPQARKQVTFVGTTNPDDRATEMSTEHLVGPLADALASDPRFAGWAVERLVGEAATRSAVLDRLGADAPTLLFTASHGVGFPNGHPLQAAHQGALLCQDWPGPRAGREKPLSEDWYVAGEHLSADTDLTGTIAFLFACFGAGTPAFDEFSKQAFRERRALAPRPFVAALPTAMLSRPKGGALAVVGHVDRAWGQSFLWAGTGPEGGFGRQTGVFESALRALLGGLPVGAAMAYFAERYAELSCDLAVSLEDLDNGLAVDERALAAMWTANNDARGYAIVGDPAVRIAVG